MSHLLDDCVHKAAIEGVVAKFGHGPGSIAEVLGCGLPHSPDQSLGKAVQHFWFGLMSHHRQTPQRVGKVLHAEPAQTEQPHMTKGN